jgi:DNA/RNA endonuclease G (NUC1)
MTPNATLLSFNGINGCTGDYLVPEQTIDQLVVAALGETIAPGLRAELRDKTRQAAEGHYGIRFGHDATNLEQVGWGIIAPENASPAVLDALRPLLDLRKAQAGVKKEHYFRQFVGVARTGAGGLRLPRGYRTGETKDEFLAYHGMAPGLADPERVPYYLLLVGSPEEIPYSFQYQLDVQYAVGRLWFETVEEYASYAQSVVAAETGKVVLPCKAIFFGTENPDDPATRMSARDLVAPLAAGLPGMLSPGSPPWTADLVRGEGQATKARLASLLGGAETPALLFTASHGMGFPATDPRQMSHQGALLCQNWQGPRQWRKEIPHDHYFAADDVGSDARLLGTIAFHFACYGAGTPHLDDFPSNSLRTADVVAPRPFVSRLPQRLLGHPKGGALAVIGHVERAWGCSILWEEAGRQIQAFEDALRLLMEGAPVGHATEAINQRYADVSTGLNILLDRVRREGYQADPFDLARQWTASNDARGYAVVGDPAVRLPLAKTPTQALQRPALEPIRFSTPASTPSRPQELPTSKNTTGTPAADASGPASAVATPDGSLVIQVPLQITLRFGAAVGQATAQQGPFGVLSFGGGTPVRIDPNFSTREGFDEEFLGAGPARVMLPRLTAVQREDAFQLGDADPGNDPAELKYHHFSVALSRSRRLAFWTAVNIDGKTHKKEQMRRGRDSWYYDPRVLDQFQVGDELYTGTDFDRGHLVRRLDPAWGRTVQAARTANDDTFHWTNCSPQHKDFNQGKALWAGLEDYLLEKAAGERKRMVVFTGPVLAAADPTYRGVQLPLKFWKVAVVARPNGRLASLAFLVDQERLVRRMISFAPDPEAVARTFQTTVENVEQLSGLDFGALQNVQAGGVGAFAPDQLPERELADFGDIRLD